MNEFSEEIIDSATARIVNSNGIVCQYPIKDSQRFLHKKDVEALLYELNNLQERINDELSID